MVVITDSSAKIAETIMTRFLAEAPDLSLNGSCSPYGLFAGPWISCFWPRLGSDSLHWRLKTLEEEAVVNLAFLLLPVFVTLFIPRFLRRRDDKKRERRGETLRWRSPLSSDPRLRLSVDLAIASPPIPELRFRHPSRFDPGLLPSCSSLLLWLMSLVPNSIWRCLGIVCWYLDKNGLFFDSFLVQKLQVTIFSLYKWFVDRLDLFSLVVLQCSILEP